MDETRSGVARVLAARRAQAAMRAGSLRALALALLVLAACALPCAAIQGSVQPRSTAFITAIARFGFEHGGTVSMSSNVEEDDHNLTVHGCTSSQWTSYLRNENNKHWNYVCGSKYKSGCEIDGLVFKRGDMLRDYEVQRADEYHFILVNCGTVGDVRLEYELLNPGGEQLSVGHQPLPHFYLAALALWVILFVCRAVDCGLALAESPERMRAIASLQVALLGVVVLKGGVALLGRLFWRSLQQSGYVNVWLELAGDFVYAASEAALLTVLTMVAIGWKITMPHMPSSEFRSVMVALALLLSTLLFFSLYNDGYYFLALMILYFFMLPKVFSTASRTGNILHTQALLLSRAVERNEPDSAGMRSAIETLMVTLKAVRGLRAFAALYCVVVVGRGVAHMFLPYYLDYVNYMLNEGVSLVACCAVLLLLRPNNYRLYHILPARYQQLMDTQLVAHPHLLDRLRHYLAHERAEADRRLDLSKVSVVRYPQPVAATHPSRMRLRLAVEEGSEELFRAAPVADE